MGRERDRPAQTARSYWPYPREPPSEAGLLILLVALHHIAATGRGWLVLRALEVAVDRVPGDMHPGGGSAPA
jgi:hypothetical protein